MARLDRKWLLTEGAIDLFWYAAVLNIFSFVVIVLLYIIDVAFGAGTVSGLNETYLPVRLLFGIAFALAFLLGGIPMFLGMLWFWYRFDAESLGLRLGWLAAFLLGAWYASTLYFFLVYRPQVGGSTMTMISNPGQR